MADAVLPISLLTFNATPQSQTVTLNWSTASETNNAYFLLERSANGAVFTELATIPGAGNSAERRDYSYTDRAPLPGTNYYRLRQVDFDGGYTFSPVRTVAFGGLAAVQVSPVPTDGRVQVSLTQGSGEALTWALFDQSGRQVRLGTTEAETRQFDVDLTDLPAGWYALRLTDGRESHVVRVMRR